jgi:hypothetical protein
MGIEPTQDASAAPRSTVVRRDLEGLTGRESVSSTRPGQISSRLAGEVRVLRHDRADERDARIELNEGS